MSKDTKKKTKKSVVANPLLEKLRQKQQTMRPNFHQMKPSGVTPLKQKYGKRGDR